MCDYPPPEAYQERLVIGRKAHRCCECDSVIDVGEKHEVVSGIWDGQPNRFRTCLICVEWREAFTAEVKRITAGDLYPDLCPPPFGNLIQSLVDSNSYVPPWRQKADGAWEWSPTRPDAP